MSLEYSLHASSSTARRIDYPMDCSRLGVKHVRTLIHFWFHRDFQLSFCFACVKERDTLESYSMKFLILTGTGKHGTLYWEFGISTTEFAK
jgi:hypothetical protein